MKKISEVTRRDLIDTIQDGFFVKELVNHTFDCELTPDSKGRINIYMPYYGRLTELDFLLRLYDLDHMPSHDVRFRTARQDIVQHTVLNDDWDDYWAFYDDRFSLSNGCEDEPLLKLMCEMLHPRVRMETKPWEEYLKRFNQLLEPDGYEIYAFDRGFDEEIYKFREKDVIEIKSLQNTMPTALRLLGEGSYAQVFKYKDRNYNQTFAVKRAKKDLSDKELSRFKREFETMASLHSPYVVEVYSYDDSMNQYIMEYMDQTLGKYISMHNSTISIQDRKSVIAQLFKGYSYLHSRGIFHRDISFHNVLVKKYDDVLVVKISDFGLVKIPQSDLTSKGSELKGQLNDPALKTAGFDRYDLLHEIYALTLLFVYVMTGKSNFASITNPHVRSFMDKGTNPDRTKRFQSLIELKNAAFQVLSKL